MALLNIAPTKSNLLTLRRHRAFAEEGYDLLEQKRQILIFELMSRLERARQTEQQVGAALGQAFAALQAATLDVGGATIDRAALAVKLDHHVELSDQHLLGLRLPSVTVRSEPVGVRFGVGGTSANMDMALQRFATVLPALAALAELENAVVRLAGELRKTQRRCNALSKVFIPNYTDTIRYITGALEERERESVTILKMIRDRLAQVNRQD